MIRAIAFSKKNDGLVKLCIDFEKLETVSMRRKYPIPNKDTWICILRQAKAYPTIQVKRS